MDLRAYPIKGTPAIYLLRRDLPRIAECGLTIPPQAFLRLGVSRHDGIDFSDLVFVLNVAWLATRPKSPCHWRERETSQGCKGDILPL